MLTAGEDLSEEFLAVLVNVVVGIPVVLARLPMGALAQLVTAVLPSLVLFFVANVGIAALYRYGPSRAPARWAWISPGSLTASAVWLIGSAGFSYYVSNLADFSATYGSLGTIAAVMMWAWISTVILLVGAEVDAEMEHQTARDTTRPPEAPLGERGAVVADQVEVVRQALAAAPLATEDWQAIWQLHVGPPATDPRTWT